MCTQTLVKYNNARPLPVHFVTTEGEESHYEVHKYSTNEFKKIFPQEFSSFVLKIYYTSKTCRHTYVATNSLLL